MKKFFSNNFFQAIKNFAIGNKKTSIVILVIIIGIIYSIYGSLTSTNGETRYIVSSAQKETLVINTTGSGQVSTSNQIDVKSKVSGDVIYVGVTAGQNVKAGTLIVKLDSTDAEKTVRDAEMSLESAKITLAKLIGDGDASSTPRNKSQAEDDLSQAYDSGFNNVSNAFLDLPGIMTGLNDILYGTTIEKSQDNISAYSDAVKDFDINVVQFKNDANSKYQLARAAYDKNFLKYKTVSRFSTPEEVDELLNETYDTTKAVAEAVKSAYNLLQFYKDKLSQHNLSVPTIANTYLTNLNSYTGTSNSHLVSMLNALNTIKSDIYAVSNADLDVRTQILSVQQKENSLTDAKNALADYYVRAPFDGIIASISVDKYSSASASTAIATLITNKKVAEISMNEVDAAKVKVGQKATLTFDAIDNLSISGEVSEVDSIGTVSQGVVTYSIKINFDTQDDRIKSGMSVNASILTEIKQDVLVVSNSAIKTQGTTNYVLIFDPKIATTTLRSSTQGVASSVAPKQQIVEIGISNDTVTEILSGLNEGDQVVERTTTVSTQTTSTTGSVFSLLGGNRQSGNKSTSSTKSSSSSSSSSSSKTTTNSSSNSEPSGPPPGM